MTEKDIKIELRLRLNEAFIVQIFFGALMLIIPIIQMLSSGVFDFSLLSTLISGALLIFYSFRFYYVKSNLVDKVLKAEQDVYKKLTFRLNEVFIVQLIFGALMIIIPIIQILSSGVFYNISLLSTIISGALLIIYSFRFYYVKDNLIERTKAL